MFWQRKCRYCGYPKSEKYRIITTDKGKMRKEYCCNLCYKLRVMNGGNHGGC